MSAPDLAALVREARDAEGTALVAERCLPLLDLTSLSGQETEAEIERLCARAREHGVAAVCIYPAHVALARSLLDGSKVLVATVAAFPAGGDDIGRAVDEVAAAVGDGAQEVDLVAPLEAVAQGDIGMVEELVVAARAAAGKGVTLKLILETGRFSEPSVITAMARAAVMGGIDFLKTSTGKIPVGATPEAAALLLAVIQEAGGRVGFKAAGGVRTVADAAVYLDLAGRILGPDWIGPGRFRIGASGLLDDIASVIAAG